MEMTLGMNALIQVHKKEIDTFCDKWNIAEMCLFGSILRDDFNQDSDIDILVAFAPDAQWSLLDMVEMKAELQEILGRKVDLLTRRAVERSNNWIRKRAILESAECIYAQ